MPRARAARSSARPKSSTRAGCMSGRSGRRAPRSRCGAFASGSKRWKITAEDIRNRARRRDYLAALDDMFAQTSTAAAPWHVVPAEYKWFARLAVAKTAVNARQRGHARAPSPRSGSRQIGREPQSQRDGRTRPGRAQAHERVGTCPGVSAAHWRRPPNTAPYPSGHQRTLAGLKGGKHCSRPFCRLSGKGGGSVKART